MSKKMGAPYSSQHRAASKRRPAQEKPKDNGVTRPGAGMGKKRKQRLDDYIEADGG